MRALLLSGLLVTPTGAPCAPLQASSASPSAPLTARQVIERIQERAGGRDSESWRGPTVDTLKAGDLDTPVTGVATTFSATMDVLQRAVARGANLVVAHEPTFYDHQDETAWLGNDPVLAAKLDYIRKHKLVVWRFHDHWHSVPGRPDGVLKGMVAGRGWVLYMVDAIGQGRPRGLILMGHDVSEELGMQECATWLRAFVSEVPVEYVPAGEPFWSPE